MYFFFKIHPLPLVKIILPPEVKYVLFIYLYFLRVLLADKIIKNHFSSPGGWVGGGVVKI